MDRKSIEWSEKFTEDVENVVAYLVYNWSKKTALSFIDKLNNKIDFITYSPFSGIPYRKYKNIYKILVTKHNALFYKIYDNRIELLNLFDTRQNPSKSPFL
ncbi:MAG: type II toxin-antitoxin system RelE/ParE family toxin [Cytophagales bacterium]